MKKSFYSAFVVLLVCLCSLIGNNPVEVEGAIAEQTACTTVTNNIVYYSANLYNYDWPGFNAAARNMTYAAYNALSDDAKLNLDKTLALTGPSSSDVRALQYTGLGLVRTTLDANGNAVNTNLNRNGVTFFPTASEVTRINNLGYGPAYSQAWFNVKFPFRKLSNGYTRFYSSEDHLKYDAGSNTLYLHAGPAGGISSGTRIVGMWPFNPDCWPESSSTYGDNVLHYGMKITIPFYMTHDGKTVNFDTHNREDMLFKFAGDDDVWVFVDNTLRLDIGGEHGEMNGWINFANNTSYTQHTGSVQSNCFGSSRLSEGYHTLTIFYMERPGGSSNFKAEFNLPDIISYSGTKTWSDNSNALGVRPSSYTLKLYRNGTHIKTSTFTSANWSFSELPKYDDTGNLYVYSVQEDNVTVSNGDYYTATISGTSVTNTLVRVLRNIKVNYVDECNGDVLGTDSYQGYVNTTKSVSAKTISGYTCVSSVKNHTLTYTVADQTITYYYRKNSDVTTTFIDQVTGDTLASQVKVTYKEGDGYVTAPKAIDGYTLVKTPSNAGGTVGRSNITVQYEYRKNSDVVVVFYDEINHEEIETRVTTTYKQGDSYTTEPKIVDGYRLVTTPANASGTIARDDVEVVYGYKKISGGVQVKFIDQATGNLIFPTKYITGLEADAYTTSPEDVTGYELVKTPTNKNGFHTVDPIIVTYEYRLKVYLTLKYVDEVTKAELKPTTTTKYLQGDSYTTTQEAFTGFEFTNRFGAQNGTFARSDITVIYYYKYNSNVTTKFVDQITNAEIATPVVTKYREQDVYTTTAKDIPGYVLVTAPANKTGVVEREDITVTYEYRKDTEGVEIRYIDQANGSLISNSIVKTGVEGTPYESESKDIPGYELVKTPANKNGTMSVSKTIVTYEYRLISYVTVNYEDEITRRQLKPSSTIKYLEGQNYTTTQDTFSGYTFTRVDGVPNGTIARTNLVITYYYKKDTSVDVKYVDMMDSDREISTADTISGIQGQAYTTSAKNIPGYEYIKCVGRPNGNMSDSPITVVYKYKKLSTVTTEHLDVDTGVKIATDVVNTYKEGDAYEVLAQSIPGYIKVEEPEEKTGVMGKNNITKTFKYKSVSDGLVVKYVDVKTNDVLEELVITGNVDDVIELETKSFMYYLLYSKPDFDSITLTLNSQEVVFYYVRSIQMQVIGIEEGTGRELFRTTIEGPEGNPYDEEYKKDLPGYDLVEMPANAKGFFNRNDREIIFTYTKPAEKIEAQVNVKYIDRDTNALLDSETIRGYVGDTYRTTRKDFTGYELVRIEGEEFGEMEETPRNVIYVYAKKTGRVIVTYEDENGSVLDSDEMTGRVGENYTVNVRNITGYEVAQLPSNIEGTYIDGIIEVRIKMQKIPVPERLGTVRVNYVDENGDILKTESASGVVGTEYIINIVPVEGYEVVEAPTNTRGTFEEGVLVITVRLQKIVVAPAEKGTITIKFVDSKGNVLLEKVVKSGDVGEQFNFNAPEIPGYRVVLNGKIKAEFKNGELVYDVIYEKIEEEPERPTQPVEPTVPQEPVKEPEDISTGDINVTLLSVIFAISFITITRKIYVRK